MKRNMVSTSPELLPCCFGKALLKICHVNILSPNVLSSLFEKNQELTSFRGTCEFMKYSKTYLKTD